jgi:Hint module
LCTPEVGTTEVLYIGDGVAPACTIAGADSPDVKQAVLLGDKKGDADSKDIGSGLSSSSDGQKCFPAAATVQLEGGDVVRMDELNIGDRVRVSGSAFSEVYFFSHRDAAAKAVFVQITIEAARLLVTPGHVLRVNGNLAVAETVSVGDKVVVVPAGAAVARSATVVDVSLVKDRGLYNPHTVHGDVVVDGVVTSCLTSALPAPVANVLLVPFKALFATVGAHPAVQGVNDAVLVALARLDGHKVSVARVSRMLFEGIGAFAGRGEL